MKILKNYLITLEYKFRDVTKLDTNYFVVYFRKMNFLQI